MIFTEEYIEDFLLGHLSEDAAVKFEQAMASDEKLRKQVEFQRALIASVQSIEADQKMSNAIKAGAQDYFGSREKNVRKTRILAKRRSIYFFVAAAACLLALFVYNRFMGPNDLDGPQIFAANYEVAPMLEFDRSTQTNKIDSLSNEVYKVYQAEDYDTADKLFSQFNLLDNASPKLLNYAASAALSKTNPDFEKGEGLYLEIINSGENLYTNAAHWNLALLSVRKNDIANAEVHLNTILAQPRNKYTEKAQILIKQL